MRGSASEKFRNFQLAKRITALFLCAALFLGMSACGKDKNSSGDVQDGSSEAQDVSPFVYYPRALDFEDSGEMRLYNVFFIKDELYYQIYLMDEETGGYNAVLRCRSLTEDTVRDIPLEGIISGWTLGEDKSLYTVAEEWSNGENGGNLHTDRFLVKQDSSGELIFRQDITQLFPENYENDYFQIELAVDEKGRSYILNAEGVVLFDEKGNPGGTVKLDLGTSIYFSSFGRGSDGKVYLSSSDMTGGSVTLYEVDYEKAELTAGYPDFPSGGGKLSWDADGNYLVVDSAGVYKYDISTKESQTLFQLGYTGLDASVISAVSGLSDGSIAVVWQDWETSKGGVVFMTGGEAASSEDEEKLELVVGILSSNPFLESAATQFNFNNDKVHITVKQYMEKGETSLNDGITRLQADIAAGNCPDILEVSASMDWQNLVKKGVFEDLRPYLNQGEGLNQDDFFQGVLDAYTYDGILTAIPSVVQIQTMLGSVEELGEGMGWTIDDVIAFSDAHPGAELIEGCGAVSILSFCLAYSMDSFVDWEKGTCSFDGNEFKRLLEFAARCAENRTDMGEPGNNAWRDKVREGKVLLKFVDMYEFQLIQFYGEPFWGGETAIGYPSSDGSPLCTIRGSDALGISAKSEAKDAAWDFIENYLTKEGRRYVMGFPTIIAKYEEMLAQQMEILTDSEGNPVLDEFGNYQPKRAMMFDLGNGEYYTCPLLSQREQDMMRYMIEHGRLKDYSSDQLLNIITEEAGAFFQGQKSVDEVVETIQRRAAVYVSENS